MTSRAFHNDLMGNFLELLCGISGMEMAFPMNSGAEAVETAIKAVRKWGYKVKVASSRGVLEVFNPGDHGSTFGGNPHAAAIAKKSLEVITDEKLSERSWDLGQYEKSFGTARSFCEKLMPLGVLAKDTHDQVIRLAPPLVISLQEIDWAMEKIESVFQHGSL